MVLKRIAESRNRQRGKDDVLQEFGTVYPVPIGLGENVRSASANALNQLLVDTMALRDLYNVISTKSITGRFPVQHFTSCICCLISITASRSS
jgi:hypothetical protein